MTDTMNPWLQFLTKHGAQIDADESRGVTGFTNTSALDAEAEGWVAPLADLGLIAAEGEEAAQFLHSQLTNDVEHLDALGARLAGYCSPKGRLLASFLMWREAERIYLQLPLELQPAVQKRLQMFVLRAKVKLQDVGPERVALGFAASESSMMQALADEFAALPTTPYAKVDGRHPETGCLIRLPEVLGLPRWQWIAPLTTAQLAWPRLCAQFQPVATAAWRLAEIRAGVPRIVRATQEQFVPQMINFELIGGVNFKKGCYPGQEIVARSQYLGKLKRRMMLASVAVGGGSGAGDVGTLDAIAAGTELFSSADPGQPCGMVVNAEQEAPSRFLCLVEVKLAAPQEGSVHLGAAEGPALQFAALPYALPETT